AAAILFLLYREQVISSATRPRRPFKLSSYLIAKGLAIFLVGVLLVFATPSGLGLMGTLHFVIPGLALTGYLVWTEAREGEGSFGDRLRRLSGLLLPFVLGVSLPIALFLTPYLLSRSTVDFYRGVFVLP